MISGCHRVCGKAQGFLGLPIRDVVETCSVQGEVHVMHTAWEPTPAELEALNRGGSVVVKIQGWDPQPMRVEVEETPPLKDV